MEGEVMQREDFTDFEAWRASIQQVDGAWLLNGGKDWRWHNTSLKVGDCEMQIGYSQCGLITQGISSNDSLTGTSRKHSTIFMIA
jgi:hypothetical protein